MESLIINFILAGLAILTYFFRRAKQVANLTEANLVQAEKITEKMNQIRALETSLHAANNNLEVANKAHKAYQAKKQAEIKKLKGETTEEKPKTTRRRRTRKKTEK